MPKVYPTTDEIDTHYLFVPQDQWGYTDLSNRDMIQCFYDVERIVKPKRVIEIGMFAGHSTLLMLNTFKDLQQMYSYDPHPVSEVNARQIVKYYNNWQFKKDGLKGNEWIHEKEPIDLIYVDGGHQAHEVLEDLKSCALIKPRYILFDNVEHTGVKTTLDKKKMFTEDLDPQFWFYVNKHKGSIKPGIFMLVNVENLEYENKVK